MLIIGLSLFPISQLHNIFSSKNGHFFNINGACKAIDVYTRREVEIKIGQTCKTREIPISGIRAKS